MPAIVTDNFKRRVIDTLINDVDSTGVSYHVAVGKSEPYDSADTVIDPIQNIREIRNAQLSMQAVKIITGHQDQFIQHGVITSQKFQSNLFMCIQMNSMFMSV